MPTPRDESDRKLLEIIDEYGWHVTLVTGDDEEPPFAYSTGIFQLTGKPEIIVFGLPQDVAHFVVNEYGNRAKAGEALSAGGYYEDFLEGHPITFVETTEDERDKRYTTWSSWFYGDQPFPVLQLVYPDSQSGAFPWQPGYREEWHWHQPLLGNPPALH